MDFFIILDLGKMNHSKIMQFSLSCKLDVGGRKYISLKKTKIALNTKGNFHINAKSIWSYEFPYILDSPPSIAITCPETYPFSSLKR